MQKYTTVKIGVLNGVEVKIPNIILDAIKDQATSVKVELISDTGHYWLTRKRGDWFSLHSQ